MGPEETRYRSRLEKRGVREFHVFPGSGSHTDEELYAELNRVEDQAEEFHSLPVEEQMRREIAQVYENLSRAIQECQRDTGETTQGLDDQVRLNRIFGELDMSLLTLGNWLDTDTKTKIKKRVRK